MSAEHVASVGPPENAKTVPEFIRSLAASYGQRDALMLDDQVISYQFLDEASGNLARGLLAHGVTKGTRIGLLFGNGPDWAVWWSAIVRIGAVAVPLSTFARGGELSRIIRHSDLQGLVMQPKHLDRDLATELESAFALLPEQSPGDIRISDAPYLRWVVVIGNSSRPWSSTKQWIMERPMESDILEEVQQEIHVDDTALIIYTSGTSATPKGVAHTHGAIMSKTHYIRKMLAVEPGAKSIALMPFFWVGGLVMSLFPTLEAGGCVECQSRSRYAAAPIGAAGTFENPYAHLPLSPALGMTETFGMYSWGKTIQDPDYPAASPMDVFEPGYEVRVIDDNGNPTQEGEIGEIVVRGPTVTRQLIKVSRPRVFMPDGFFRTGDRGIRNGGRICFIGRLGDMIKTSGANVAPPEVEREIVSIDGINAAFVVGLPHVERGQEVVAAIICEPHFPFSMEELRSTLKDRLSAYKVPRRMVALTWKEIPMTPSQKVDRRALAAVIHEQLGGDPKE